MSVLEALNIPTLTKQRVPVKTLVEQLQPTPENRRLIESHVASIYLVSLLMNKRFIIELIEMMIIVIKLFMCCKLH